MQVFEGRTDELFQLLTAAGIMSKDLTDDDKCEGLSMYFFSITYDVNYYPRTRKEFLMIIDNRIIIVNRFNFFREYIKSTTTDFGEC